MMKVLPQWFSRSLSSRRLFVAAVSVLTALTSLPHARASVTLTMGGTGSATFTNNLVISGGTLTLSGGVIKSGNGSLNLASGATQFNPTTTGSLTVNSGGILTSTPVITGGTLSLGSPRPPTGNAVILPPANVGYPIVTNNPPVSNQINVSNPSGGIDATGPITSTPPPTSAPLRIAAGVTLSTIGTKPSTPKNAGVFTVDTIGSISPTGGTLQTGSGANNLGGGGLIKTGTGTITIPTNTGTVFIPAGTILINPIPSGTPSGGSLSISGGNLTLTGTNPVHLSLAPSIQTLALASGGTVTDTAGKAVQNGSLTFGSAHLTLSGSAQLIRSENPLVLNNLTARPGPAFTTDNGTTLGSEQNAFVAGDQGGVGPTTTLDPDFLAAAQVPEPSTALLAALGMGLLGVRRRR